MKKKRGNSNNKIVMRVDNRIYGKESLALASRVLSDRLAVVFRKAGGGAIEVTLRNAHISGQSLPRNAPGLPPPDKSADGGLEFLTGEFFNEALNQECRLNLSRENANIQKMLITKAFLSARADSREQPDAAKGKTFEREVNKLLMQAKKEMAVQGRVRGGK